MAEILHNGTAMPPDAQEVATALDHSFQLHRMQLDMVDIKTSMSKIADALTKIAVLEEKHQTVSTVQIKMIEKVDGLEKRQAALELTNAAHVSAVQTASKAVAVAWAVLGAGILALAAKIITSFAVAAPVVATVIK